VRTDESGSTRDSSEAVGDESRKVFSESRSCRECSVGASTANTIHRYGGHQLLEQGASKSWTFPRTALVSLPNSPGRRSETPAIEEPWRSDSSTSKVGEGHRLPSERDDPGRIPLNVAFLYREMQVLQARVGFLLFVSGSDRTIASSLQCSLQNMPPQYRQWWRFFMPSAFPHSRQLASSLLRSQRTLYSRMLN